MSAALKKIIILMLIINIYNKGENQMLKIQKIVRLPNLVYKLLTLNPIYSYFNDPL